MSFKSDYNRIKHSLVATGNPYDAVKKFVFGADDSTVYKFSSSLMKEALFRNAVSGNPFPQKYDDLDSCGYLPFSFPIERALFWNYLSFYWYRKELKRFLELKDTFDHHFLLGETENCIEILDIIVKEFGHSLWECRSRLAFLQEYGKENELKQYQAELINHTLGGGINRYLIYCYAQMCTYYPRTSSYLIFIRHQYEYFIQNNYDPKLVKFLKQKTNGYLTEKRDYFDNDSISFFLAIDNNSALIDRYLSLRELCYEVFQYGTKEIQKTFLPVVKKIELLGLESFWKNVSDIQMLGYHEASTQVKHEIIDVYDLYSVGDYEKCVENATSLIEKDIACFPLMEVLLKSMLYIKTKEPVFKSNSLFNKIVESLLSMMSWEGDLPEDYLDVILIPLLHMDTAWGHQLKAIIDKLFYRRESTQPSDNPGYYATIITANDIFNIENDAIEKYLQQLPYELRNSISLRFCEYYRTGNIEELSRLNVEETRRKRYIAKLLLGSNKAGEALQLLETIKIEDMPVTVVSEVTDLIITAQQKEGNLKAALSVFVETYFKNKNYYLSGTSIQLQENIKEYNQSIDSVLFPVFIDIFNRNWQQRNPYEDMELNACYEDYLDTTGIERPSELLNVVGEDNWTDIYTYFLEYVCAPVQMDHSLTFDSNEDVMNERIRICQQLILLAPERSDKYEREINEIASRMKINQLRQNVETGKIYIDIDGIRRNIVRDLGEDFERYQRIRDGYENNILLQQLKEDLQSISQNSPVISYFDEDEMLTELIKNARNIFVADNKYGLDGCLSVRIRHGTLSGTIRNCFESHGLVTKKAIDGSYKPNDRWSPTEAEDSRAQVVFAQFSEKIDEIIQRMIKQFLQIQTEERNPEGAFEYSFDFADFIMQKSQIGPDAGIETFADNVIAALLDKTDENLQNVREKIKGTYLKEFTAAIDEMELELEKQHKDVLTRDLRNNLVNVRTEIASVLERISNWFQFDRPGKYPDFSLKLAAEISGDIIMRVNNRLKIDCNEIDETIILSGDALANFVEIFNILLDNAAKYGKGEKWINTKLIAARENDNVKIIAENEAENINLEKISEIQRNLEGWENSGAVAREGGSGLLKLKKILTVDLNSANSVMLIPEDELFRVAILANLQEKLR